MLNRAGLVLATALCAAAWHMPSHAADFPSKTVHVIVPFAPGGGADVMARVLAEGLARRWSSPVVVESKPGAGTVVATQYVLNTPADGHTLLIVTNTLTTNPAVRDNLPYDTFRDLVAIGSLATQPNVLVASTK